jgi:N-acetylglucosamine-6-phosphate deacetylase
LVTPSTVIAKGVLVISEEGRIRYAGDEEQAPPIDGSSLDLEGMLLLPGLIDIHTHGGYGTTFGAGDLADGLKRYAVWAASTGVTGFLVSLAAPTVEALLDQIQAYAGLCEGGLPGAELLGIHLEGPFLNPDRKGAFAPSWLRVPDAREARVVLEAGRGWIRQVTLAPEMEGAGEVASLFRQAGVVVALGHSNASCELAARALAGEFTHVTHTYNAQSRFDHRQPGVVGAILTSRSTTAELIADTVHVHPAAMQVLYRCLGKDRLILVTDAMAGAGLPDGEMAWMERVIRVRQGRATLPDGTLAGSTATLNDCVVNMNRAAGIPFAEAVRMATVNPARVAGVSHRLGQLEAGMEASLTVMDLEGGVSLAIVKGRIVYQRCDPGEASAQGKQDALLLGADYAGST